MKIQAETITLNNTRLYYETVGSGPALVFIHGMSLDCRMWDSQFETFARRFHVIRYDLRGFGRSDPPTTEPYAHADDLLALLEHLGIEQAHICGLSLGGMVAVNFALLYPQKTASLITVDAALGGYQWQDFGKIMSAVFKTGVTEGIESAREKWFNAPIFSPILQNEETAPLIRQMVSDYSGWHWLNRNPWRQPEPAPIHRLAEITAPSLIIAGERDLPDFLNIANILANGIAGAQKVIIPGVGHMANMEAPVLFNEIVLNFLNRR